MNQTQKTGSKIGKMYPVTTGKQAKKIYNVPIGYSIENQIARGKALIEIKRKIIKLTKSYNHCEKGLNFLSGVFIIRNYKD